MFLSSGVSGYETLDDTAPRRNTGSRSAHRSRMDT